MSHAAAAPPAEHTSMELESSAVDATGAQSSASSVAADREPAHQCHFISDDRGNGLLQLRQMY
jgi:hypothetical protein